MLAMILGRREKRSALLTTWINVNGIPKMNEEIKRGMNPPVNPTVKGTEKRRIISQMRVTKAPTVANSMGEFIPILQESLPAKRINVHPRILNGNA